MTVVIAIAGVIGVGKSAVATQLHGMYGFEIRSYGRVVRQEAARQGHTEANRGVLQDTGQSLIESLGARGLTDRVLSQPYQRLVIDGLRHLDVLDDLECRIPQLVSVLLTASVAVLDQRWATRGIDLPRSKIAAHPVEREALSLRERVTLTINTDNLSPDEIARVVASAASWD